MIMMIKSSLARITAYVAENRIETAPEAENMASDKFPAKEIVDDDTTNVFESSVANDEVGETLANLKLDSIRDEDTDIGLKKPDRGATKPEDLRLDCIYDDSPLGFEKPVANFVEKMEAQDPLEEVDLGDGSKKRPTYISSLIDPELKQEMINLL